jgi:hypothetical protein
MNAYQLSSLGFAKAYRASMEAADAQRRANAPDDSAFAEINEEDERSMIGSPSPQPPSAPDEQFDGGTSALDAIEGTQESKSVMMRAKKRASKYLNQSD